MARDSVLVVARKDKKTVVSGARHVEILQTIV